MTRLLILLVCSLLTRSLNAQWVEDPAVNNLICSRPQDQQDARIVTDAQGGAIITWVDFRNDQNNTTADIYAQRISADGHVLWTVDGVPVCVNAADQTAPMLVEDGAGGAIIVWQDWRSGDRDIYAQRIDNLGNVLWTANGVGVAVKVNEQRGPVVISDGAQGAVIVWTDAVSGNWDIYAQRLNASGTAQWANGGVALCNAPDDQINPKVTTDATGAVYVTWQDRRNAQDYDIYAQKLGLTGAVQWANNGVAVSTATNSQVNPKMETLSTGNVVIAWQNFVTGAGYDIYAQMLNASGVVQWANGGASVCAMAGNQSAIDMTTDAITDGAIICWKDGRNAKVNIYCQKLDLTGAAQWTANGKLVSAAGRDQINPNVVGDGDQGTIITWQDSVAGVWDVYAQRVDGAAGNTQWAAEGVAVGVATDNQTGPKHVSDGNGGAIFSFQDKRSGDFDIYAYKLSGNGVVNSIGETQADSQVLHVFPNPFSDHASVTLPDGTNHIRLFDMVGRQLLSETVVGAQLFDIQRGPLASGTYFLTVQNGEVQYSAVIITE
ncbi:MAG: T9SS type A sorting domain-containing protein [Flavobacteriales bacterium]|nr:T9SS type A sorting domain-containing protein [Flavobacteriales bacterium]